MDGPLHGYHSAAILNSVTVLWGPKNIMMKKLFCVFLLFLCFECSKPLPILKGIDLQGWREDNNACKNLRKPMREAMDREKVKLLGLDEVQLVTLLGSPDKNELYSRNEKFYYYFIGPAPSCPSKADSVSEKLVIRFNSVGLAKEVSIE